MSKIVPKLNLNKTPQLVENNSLIYAKNIRLLNDGTLAGDTMCATNRIYKNYVGQIVGLNDEYYLFTTKDIYVINEVLFTTSKLDCNWTYHGGKITGIVTINNIGEKILTVCEYDTSEKVPIKHINVDKCSAKDNESIYTQNPEIPISNIYLAGKYSATIPNGVYQFYIRYKIRKDFYTPWFPCSGELYAGENQRDYTIQGSIRYIDTNYDCSKSFILDVEHLDATINSYKEYQLGFIISNDNGTYGRSWKTFKMDTNKIYFTYDIDDIKEIDIDELTKINYELLNVGNITYYKNKLYISNYEETNFDKEVNIGSTTVNLSIADVNTTNVDNIDNIALSINDDKNYSKWGNKNISELIATKHNNAIVSSRTTTTPKKIDIITAEASVKTTEFVGRDITTYSIITWKNHNLINGVSLLDDFTIDNYSGYLYSLGDSNSNYVTVTDNRNLVSTIHPLRNIPNLDKYWLWCSTKNKTNNFIFNDSFRIYHNDIHDITTPNNHWKKQILDAVKDKYPSTVISKIIINPTATDSTKVEILNNSSQNGITVAYKQPATYSQIEQVVFNIIKPYIQQMDSKGNYIITYNNITCAILNISVEYHHLSYDLALSEDENKHNTTFAITSNILTVKDELQTKVNINDIKKDIINVDERTLMPFTNYEFYLHTVSQNGIISNGHYIGEKLHKGYTEENKVQIIYPEISDVPETLNDAKAWFISAYASKNKVARGFNHYTDDEYHYIDCLECDTLLYNLNKNINIYKNSKSDFSQVTSEAEYVASGNSTIPKLFGNAGVIRWRIKDNELLDNDYESLTQSIKIPVTNGEASGTICVYINRVNDKGKNESKVAYIDLSKKSSSESLKSYINSQLSAIIADFADNLTISITANFKDKYKELSSSFSTILDESTSTYYQFDSDGKLTALNSENIIDLNEDDYNANVLKLNQALQLKSLELDSTQASINNASLAIGINSVTEENYNIKSSITGAKDINTRGTDGADFLDITSTCSKKGSKGVLDGDATSNNECVTGQAMYKTDLNNITVASADTTQLADSINATQLTIKSISNDIKGFRDITDIKSKIELYENNVSKGTAGNVINLTKNGKTITIYDKNSIFKVDDATDYYEVIISSNDDNKGINNISALTLCYESGINSINGGNKTIKNNISKNKNISSKLDNVILGKINHAKTKCNSYWVVIDDDDTTNEHKQLIKITPYIPVGTTEFNDYKKMNLPGFICTVEKLDHAINDIIYVNGTDVYNKEITEDNCIELTELKGKITNRLSNVFYVPSNFNLNCLKLREDLTTAIRVYTTSDIKYNDEDSINEITEEQGRQTFKAFNSLVASSIYELPKMYKDYLKHTYSTIQENTITKFDNTIRSSSVNVDEAYINIYTFKAEDYYHVPANRGKITYLFTILDTIFVHNQHALYKFSGKNSLSSEGGSINLQPTDAFDNGISVLLDSNNGYGGLKEKHHALIMSNSYIFYDAYAKVIYGYVEQAGIINLSESINKLFESYSFTDVKFIADEPRNRFYVSLEKGDDNICLSYNFNIKGFISIHDLLFDSSFSTRLNTYVIKTRDDSTYIHIIQNTPTNYKADFYGACTKTTLLSNGDDTDLEQNNRCTFDVIYNNYYETIKVLDNINWIVSKINVNNSTDSKINMAEELLDKEYSGYQIRIYSDQGYTDKIDVQNKISNKEILDSTTNYTYPRYNQGVWSMNYFRNIVTNPNNTQNTYNVDEQLLYGKYFVFRIILDEKFKFENVTFNITDYEKV